MTTKAVMDLTGASPRQLHYWDQRGYVLPHLLGRKRYWTERDVFTVMVLLACKRKTGLDLGAASRAAWLLEKNWRPWLVIGSNGSTAFLETADEIVEYIKCQPCGVWLIEVPQWQSFGPNGRAKTASA